MAQKLQQQLKEVGSKLETPPASKDALVKLLKQGAIYLCELDQSPPKSMVESMQPLLNALVKPELLKHQDREVKLFVAACICEITRITAPEAPYDDDVLKDIFQLIVGTFSGLIDVNSPSFGRRVVILETLARYRSCVVMLDLECDDLINEMFDTFFSVARDELPGNVLSSMQTIMEVILEESEDVPENLLVTLLTVLGDDRKAVTAAAKKIALNVIENCAVKLESSIRQFLVSSMSGESRSLICEIDYHAVLYDIYRCAPQILSGVVPYLTGELLSDQLDIRMKAVSLAGDLFALPGSTISESFKPVFVEFLKRLTDRAVEVRMSVLEHVKTCLLENPFRSEAHQIISALCDRLLDYDENVRKKVVSVVCDVACHALTSVPVETIKLVSERLRDKSLLVKRYTMERLAEIHRTSCMKQSRGSLKDDEYGWVVSKILRCFYDKDFRSDAVEPILAMSLFPADFSVRDKVKRWVMIFSGFDKVEVTALEKILEQKQRLQQEMQKYLSLRQLTQEGDGTEIRKKVMYCFRVMSRCFTDPAKAEENFHILDQLRDSNIWKILKQLLDPNTSSAQCSSLRGDLLEILGQKHRLYGFLTTLSLKTSYLLFNKDHVREILLEARIQKTSESSEILASCMTVLVILARFYPSLLGGLEEDLVHLLEDDNEILKEGTLHILAKAGSTIREQLGVSSRSLDLILERICIEGSRRQAKYAVYALASITKDDGLMALSVLYKRLVDMLEEKSHLPAVLQSLGCIAQAALPVYETREIEVKKFIKENILEVGQKTGDGSTCWADRSGPCSLKIFGLKALVKSCLSVKDPNSNPRIDDVIGILMNILMFGEISREIESSLVDRAHLKLAAAKAVLRLLKKWEHKIPVNVLYLALRSSEDDFPEVKKLLLHKVHQYVRDHILDPKFACAFLLDISSSQSDFEENKRYLNEIIQMCRQRRARQISLQTDSNSPSIYPEYILPYVVHSLAHHPSFPNVDECKDVKAFEPMYRQLYFFLRVLVHGDADGKLDVSLSKNKESIGLLHSIFQCIKCSEDALDISKSKNSHALCDLGVSIIKRVTENQGELQESTPVVLPPVLYSTLEKKDENGLLVGAATAWVADEGMLAYFESLQLDVKEIEKPVDSEDDTVKDSDTEGNEMPLGKLLQRLKAKAAKTRKEVKHEHAQAEVEKENDFSILQMVKEMNSGNQGAKRKFESSNGHGHDRKTRRCDHQPQKSKIRSSEPTDVSVPKHRRSSVQAQKSLGAVTSKGSKRPSNVNNVNNNIDFDKLNDNSQTSSEDQRVHEKTEPVDSELLTLRVKKLISSSKKKGKRASTDPHMELKNTQEAKKSKKVSNTDSLLSISSSTLGSQKKQNHSNATGLEKCTTKKKKNSIGDLIGCRIKVWWPVDKLYYEGVVKSFDTEKNKHVVLYDDGDVEVLRLDRERWDLVKSGLKAKRSGSSKDSPPKGRSSGLRKKSGGGPNHNKKLGRKSPSQVRSKRTQRTTPKGRSKLVLESESLEESYKTPGVVSHEISMKSPIDNSGSDNEPTETSVKSLHTRVSSEEDDGEKPQEDVELLPSDDEEAKEREKDSEDTENVGRNSQDSHGSDDEAVSSSDKQQPSEEATEESGEEADEADYTDRHAKSSKKLNKKSASHSVDKDVSDDEPLVLWKQRCKRQ
ncbi:sister chromatid cohesion protein PDS5 homolog A-like isoform X1 [Salvia hispanica]|uniref:sister chromatid cohesion protein PDS5 homolog A-like isoform X1 n=1 Tax=Salvia hispanica TaxID=49212 RepID=UPI002009A804|nr:sister chromatid cohesion protein PDS5 homolog A-like isoform X1 [Salvia hispanica]